MRVITEKSSIRVQLSTLKGGECFRLDNDNKIIYVVVQESVGIKEKIYKKEFRRDILVPVVSLHNGCLIYLAFDLQVNKIDGSFIEE